LQGFCSLLIQWQPQQALVTTLEEYRQMGSNAPAHFAMTCYTELASSHQLVLLRGDVMRPELINTAEVNTVLAEQEVTGCVEAATPQQTPATQRKCK
jgi:hypothetical protein